MTAPLPSWVTTLHSPLAATMGLILEEVTPQRASGRMPVAGNTQPYGLWHGGASGVLIESLASMAALAYALPDRVATGVDLNATHHRPVTGGWVHGVATALHLGRTTAHYDVVLTDDTGARVCTGRLTCHLLPRPS